MSALAHPREVFPLTPRGGTAAVFPGVPEAFYDPESQVSLTQEGDPITAMGRTETPTVPDGNVPNPPPLDEGAKD